MSGIKFSSPAERRRDRTGGGGGEGGGGILAALAIFPSALFASLPGKETAAVMQEE